MFMGLCNYFVSIDFISPLHMFLWCPGESNNQETVRLFLLLIVPLDMNNEFTGISNMSF